MLFIWCYMYLFGFKVYLRIIHQNLWVFLWWLIWISHIHSWILHVLFGYNTCYLNSNTYLFGDCTEVLWSFAMLFGLNTNMLHKLCNFNPFFMHLFGVKPCYLVFKVLIWLKSMLFDIKHSVIWLETYLFRIGKSYLV